ncbi:MAG: hypothetical protein QXH44_08315 [Pyrobaculum sp.]
MLGGLHTAHHKAFVKFIDVLTIRRLEASGAGRGALCIYLYFLSTAVIAVLHRRGGLAQLFFASGFGTGSVRHRARLFTAALCV